jgi:hypothetical protein
MARRLLLLLLAAAALWQAGCADRPRRNPLDSRATRPLDRADALEALADNGQVRLRWDFTRFDDIEAVRLWRLDEGEDEPQVVERPAADTSFVDSAVVNGRIYRYWLSLALSDGEEVGIEGEQLATPGPEHGWVADAGSGLVWRLTPDGRRGLFARGRFPALSGLAVDGRTGSAWVADERLSALHRIDLDGTMTRLGTSLRAGGALALDTGARYGWVADAAQGAVFRFLLDAEGDSLRLSEVDATLRSPVALAASPRGGLWIADSGEGRVLWFNGDGLRAGQWDGLAGLVDLDASGIHCCQAWAIAGQGARLLRLTPRAAPRDVPFPYGAARAVDVDDETGAAWVLGEGGVVAYDAEGGILMQLVDVPGAVGLHADETNEQLWLAGETELWKVTLSGLTYRTQLTGFTRITGLTVDPGL